MKRDAKEIDAQRRSPERAAIEESERDASSVPIRALSTSLRRGPPTTIKPAKAVQFNFEEDD